MTETFTIRRQVEFNHCDPAGIVFYPRYFEMISALIERFFADEIGAGWARMSQLPGTMGTPLGDIHVSFRAPSRLEDWLDLSLVITRLGNASATFELACRCGDELRFTGQATVVYASVDEGRTAPWPDEMRAGMSRFLRPEDQP